MIRKIILLISFIFFSQGIVVGGDFFEPITVGTSAAMVSRGNIEGFSTNSNALFENPASLYHVQKHAGSLSLFNTTLMEEVNYQNIAYALPILKDRAVFGLGFARLAVDDIPSTIEVIQNGSEDTGDPGINNSVFERAGSYTHSRYQVNAALGFSQSDTLHWGVSGKYYSFALDDYTGSGVNLDLGLVIDSGPWAFSFALKNFLSSSTVSYTGDDYTAEETLAFQNVYGLRLSTESFNFYGQIRVSGSEKIFTKAFGGTFTPSFMPIINFSAGYKEYPAIQNLFGTIGSTTIQSFTAGVGLDLFMVDFDYAYESSDHVIYNNKHYFSVAINL